MTIPVNAHILIILMGSLGDVARGLVVVDQLKRNFPGVHLTWLVEPKCLELVKLHPQIDRILTFRRDKGLAGVVSTIRQLRKERFDLVLDMQRHFKSGVFSFLSRAPLRIGFHRRNSKEGNFLFNTAYIDFRDEAHTAKLEQYLSFVTALGGSIKEPLHFGLVGGELRPELQRELSSLPSLPRIGLILGSSWESKDWPEHGYVELINEMQKKSSCIFILLGDGSHAARAARIKKACIESNCIDFTARTSISELVPLLSALNVCVGPDSGPMHIAAGVGTPYIALFGATSPERVAPYRSAHLVLRANLGCMPCYRRRCPGLGTLCMRLLSAQFVVDKLCEVLNGTLGEKAR